MKLTEKYRTFSNEALIGNELYENSIIRILHLIIRYVFCGNLICKSHNTGQNNSGLNVQRDNMFAKIESIFLIYD